MKTKITHHKGNENGYFHLVIDAPEIVTTAVPGQFIMLRVADSSWDPLLRRPISIMNTRADGSVEMLYKVVGKGTELLSRLIPGTELDVVGPLGHGFQMDTMEQTALLVGGGIGIPPLLFLASHLMNHGIETHAFLGARTAVDLPMVDRFEALGVHVNLATESGELGTRGLVTAPLLAALDTMTSEKPPVIYACGPDPMLRVLHRLSEMRTIPAQLSLEEHMGCGVGACLGCVVETRMGYQRVCKDGPVFLASDLQKWKS